MKTKPVNPARLIAIVSLSVVPLLPHPVAAQGSVPASAAATPPAPALPPAAPPSPLEPSLAAPAPAAPPSVSRRTVAVWAAGISAAGAVTATVFGILALKNKSDYQSHPSYSNSDNGNNDAAYADGALALAIAAGITSLVLFVTAEPPEPGVSLKPSMTLSAAPVITPHGGGAGAILRF